MTKSSITFVLANNQENNRFIAFEIMDKYAPKGGTLQ